VLCGAPLCLHVLSKPRERRALSGPDCDGEHQAQRCVLGCHGKAPVPRSLNEEEEECHHAQVLAQGLLVVVNMSV
jgi:hypothetical protein